MTDPAEKLDTYLVGGAVRDEIMGKTAKDRDWVVVGSSPETMVELGFRPVGKNFPVFLHPETQEEYALARTEKKVSRGYHGFVFNSSPEITLEEDLARRDLTINAIARKPDGCIIDPFGGVVDVQNKRLRHVSDSFREDPVRVLRVARFAARFADSGFNVDPATINLMRDMVRQREVDALVPERVWQELHSSLGESKCSRFVQILRDCGALSRILPEVDALFGVPQVEKFHPEIDTGVHTLMSLDAIQKITDERLVIFAVLVHDLGKGLTPDDELPRHRGHERRGLKPIESLCDRLSVPAKYRDFALRVCEYHLHGHMIAKLKPVTILKLLEAFDGFRKPQLVNKFCQACLADKRGRTGHENDSDESMKLLLRYHKAAQDVDAGKIASLFEQGEGSRIKKKIRQARLSEIQKLKPRLV